MYIKLGSVCSSFIIIPTAILMALVIMIIVDSQINKMDNMTETDKEVLRILVILIVGLFSIYMLSLSTIFPPAIS